MQLGNTSKDLESRNSKSEAMIHVCRHNWRWSPVMPSLVASDNMPKLLPKCPINISRASTDKCSATAAKHFTATLANCPRSDDGAESSSKSCASCFVSPSAIFCFDKAEALCSAQLGRTCARMLQAAMGKTKAVSTLCLAGCSSHCAKRFKCLWKAAGRSKLSCSKRERYNSKAPILEVASKRQVWKRFKECQHDDRLFKLKAHVPPFLWGSKRIRYQGKRIQIHLQFH